MEIKATPKPKASKTSMAGIFFLESKKKVPARATTATSGWFPIILIPSRTKERPRPSMIPRMIGLAVILCSQETAPVNPMTSQKTAVNIPEPQIIPWVILSGWAMAIPPIAFMGCTGKGVLKYWPTKILKMPKATKMPKGSILFKVM